MIGSGTKAKFFFAVLTAALSAPVFAQSSDFERGRALFIENRSDEALGFFERAFTADPAHAEAALYLGMVYEQLGRLDEAIAVYRAILPRGGSESARIAYNLGNAYFRKGTASFAEQYYTQAIRFNGSYASAYLNRANARIKTGALKDAVADYERFLALEPSSSQRPQIEKLIGLIRDQEAAEAMRRLMAEEAARAELEQRRRLMDEVSASLQASVEAAEGISAGAEDLSGYTGEFELE
ncbi:MAG: tetratricopeptide repeat protein [Treponema sp.]|jgi:tetratricopeptide (TPR) repeat protein|nr:tetratricopeptide repeat protein [Treponema sp.]